MCMMYVGSIFESWHDISDSLVSFGLGAALRVHALVWKSQYMWIPHREDSNQHVLEKRRTTPHGELYHLTSVKVCEDPTAQTGLWFSALWETSEANAFVKMTARTVCKAPNLRDRTRYFVLAYVCRSMGHFRSSDLPLLLVGGTFVPFSQRCALIGPPQLADLMWHRVAKLLFRIHSVSFSSLWQGNDMGCQQPRF